MTTAMNPGTPKGCERIAYAVGFQENATYSDVYGGGGAIVGLDCHLIRPADTPSDTLIVFMHPVGGGMYLPLVRQLAKQGHHVLWANSRYRGADYALMMEKVACDLGEAICDAKERLGYSNIVLAGWSGGGSLMMWYQALAQRFRRELRLQRERGCGIYVICGTGRLPHLQWLGRGIRAAARQTAGARRRGWQRWVDACV